jgi:hypothetical protein
LKYFLAVIVTIALLTVVYIGYKISTSDSCAERNDYVGEDGDIFFSPTQCGTDSGQK